MTTPTSPTGPADSEPPPVEPLVLSGPPGRLQATVELGNSSSSRLTVRELVLRRKGLADLGVPFAAIVAPSGMARVPLSIGLPAHTAPGDYPAEIDIAGQSRPAVLRVELSLEMSLKPGTVLATPGHHEIALTVTSRANVEIPLAATTKGRTQDGDSKDGPDISVSLFAATVLLPGETRQLTGWLDVPTDLDPERRHTALVPIGLADLRVVVLPGAPSDVQVTRPIRR